MLEVILSHPFKASTEEVEAEPKEKFHKLPRNGVRPWLEIPVTTSSRAGEGFGGRNGCSEMGHGGNMVELGCWFGSIFLAWA
jgi:hypothetical protein